MTAATFFDQQDQNRILSVTVANGEINLPSVQSLRDFGKRSSAPFFIELEIQQSSPTVESLRKLSTLIFHPDYLKIFAQPLIGISGKPADMELITRFFRDLGYSHPLIILNPGGESFFVPIHIQDNFLIIDNNKQDYESLIAESFIYVTDGEIHTLAKLENNIRDQFSDKPYFTKLMERNSGLFALQMKLLVQAAQIGNLQEYNERLRTESKKEIEWYRNEHRNYTTWYGPGRRYLAKVYRKVKNLYRKYVSL